MHTKTGQIFSRTKRALLMVGALAMVNVATAQVQNAPVTLRVNTVGLTTEGGLYVAIEKGYFAAEGIKIQLIPGSTSNSDTISQLASGEMDIGVMNLGAAYINARSRNVPIKAIAPIYVVNAGEKTTGIVIRKDLIDSGRYKTTADLKGLKVAVSALGNTSHYSLMRAAERAGLKQSDVEVINMPLPDTVVAMGNKAIDGSFLVEPFITVASKRKIAELKIPEVATSPGLPALMYAASGDALKNKDALVRFLSALLRGQRDFHDSVANGTNAQAMYDILAKHGQIKDVARLKEISLPLVSVNGTFNPKVVEDLQAFLVSQKIISRPVKTTDLFATEYLQAALDKVGRAKE